MSTVRITTTVADDGTLVLKNLPFHVGDKVEVTISEQVVTEESNAAYPLRGKPVCYKDPFDSVAEEDWESLR